MIIRPPSRKNIRSMREFISSNGGSVRFDAYMKEHLFNKECGFYEKVIIGPDGDFDTRAAHPVYAHLIYLHLKKYGLEDKDFLEIGGGNGSFKRNYLAHSPSTDYISVDASNELLKKQKQKNTKTFYGTASDLTLETNSLEGAVFSNELIDELPCRVFKIGNEKGEIKIKNEGYVTADGMELSFEFMSPERDGFLLEYEKFLREKRPEIEDGSIISVSPETGPAISEMNRVLKRGKIIVVDYGYWNESCRAFSREKFEAPFFTSREKCHYKDEFLKNPYNTDITYKIDFEFMKWLAKKMNFPSINLEYQHDFSGDLMIENGWIVNGIPDPDRFPEDSSMFIAYRDFTVLELNKN